jgi:zinc finger SWIM domain-containing protein 3
MEEEKLELAVFLQSNYPRLDTEIVLNEQNQVVGIYLQDCDMKEMFRRFPEVMLVDATHNTNTHDMPLYVLMCVDGQGHSHAIGSFLVQQEDEFTLRKMLQILKERNSAHDMIKVVITDKDMSERKVIKELFQQVEMQICLFHVLRDYNRQVRHYFRGKDDAAGESNCRRHELITSLAKVRT